MQAYLDRQFADARFDRVRELLEEVRAFYGPAFRVNLRGTPDGVSSFRLPTVEGGGARPSLEAHIDLNTTTDRVPAAACHELLHLALPARGFPVPRGLMTTADSKDDADITELINQTINVVQQDIFFDEFLARGLPANQFLSPQKIISYKEQAKHLMKETGWRRSALWPLWYLDLRLRVTQGDPRAEGLLRACTIQGSKALPDFADRAAAVQHWINARDHFGADTYACAINSLFEMVGLPASVQFRKLERVEGEGPRLIDI
jgi:hypothetical protein